MNIAIACGTRPDVLKLSPLFAALSPDHKLDIWWSGQGPDIFPEEYRKYVSVSADIPWTSLNEGISRTITEYSAHLTRIAPDLVMVHGDDATAFACGVAAYNLNLPLAHVEAGLRTYSRLPHPEEGYRRALGAFSTLHFAPDKQSQSNLISEGVHQDTIFVVGNTINDVICANPSVDPRFRIIATLHRRENAGQLTQSALDSLNLIQSEHDLAHIRVISHPNWALHSYNTGDLTVISPIPHDSLLKTLQTCDLVVTDSGGLQEECAFLGIPCIVYRESSERTALVECAAVEIAPPSRPFALEAAINRAIMRRFAYGTGDSAAKIAEIVRNLG